MEKYYSPSHIVSAQSAELGITFGQQTVDGGKTNEIPAVRKLLNILQIEGCIVVANALTAIGRTGLYRGCKRKYTTQKGATGQWHYYFSGRRMTTAELLRHMFWNCL